MAWNSATALDALRGSNLLGLGMLANQMRHNLHPEPVVTYELRGRPASMEDVIAEVVHRGEANVNLEQIRDIQHASLDALKAHLVAQREKLPKVTFHRLPISGQEAFSENLLALAKTLPALQAAGLRSISAHVDSDRPSSSQSELSSLLKTAASCGLSVFISVTIGNSESLERRVQALVMLHTLQQESNAIEAVLLRVHHAATPEARREEETTAVDYLKTLAVTRLLLENVPHVQTDWSVMGPKVLELALRFGADDAGAIPWSQTGSLEPSHHGGEAELRRIIRDAGFHPVERDVLFRQSLLR